HRLVLADLTGSEVPQHRVQLIELQLLQVEITQERGGKGAQLLRRFDQPVQHRIGIDLKNPRGGTDAQPLGQACQHAHNELHRHRFAMKDGAMMLGKVAVAGGTVELTPWTTTRMAVGSEIPPPYPASIVTGGLGAEMPGGIDLTRPPVGRGHRSRSHRWRWRGMRGLVFTQRTRGLLGQAYKRCGLLGAFTPRLDGRLRRARPPRGHGTWGRPGQMEQDTEPEQSEERELIEKQRRNHGIAPLHGGVMGGLYRVLELKQLSAPSRYTAKFTRQPVRSLAGSNPSRC